MSTSPANPARPLFYERPEPLNAAQHGDCRLKLAVSFRFAARTNSVPITAEEFALVLRDCPIVFAGDSGYPMAVVGLAGTNRFVDAEGRWRAGAYIPAYVRRYPFVLIERPDEPQLILAIDMASDRIRRAADGTPDDLVLYDNGKPGEPLQEALKFCAALHTAHAATAAFGQELKAKGILVERTADAALADGRRFELRRFLVVDTQRYATLPDSVIVDWHKKGWTALIDRHLVSQANWQRLLDLEVAARAETAAA